MVGAISEGNLQGTFNTSYGKLKKVKHEDSPLFLNGVQKEANSRLKSIAELATQKESEGEAVPMTVMTTGAAAGLAGLGAKAMGIAAISGPVGWVIGGGIAIFAFGGAWWLHKHNNTSRAANTANKADVNLGNDSKTYNGSTGLMTDEQLKKYAALSGYDTPLHVLQVAFPQDGNDSKIQVDHAEIDSTKFKGNAAVDANNQQIGIKRDATAQISRNYKEFMALYVNSIRGDFQSDKERQRFLDIAKALTTDTSYIAKNGTKEDSTFFDINQDGFINDGDLNFIRLLNCKDCRKEYLEALLNGGSALKEKMATSLGQNLDIDGSGHSDPQSPIADEKDKKVLTDLMSQLGVKTIDELLAKYDSELKDKVDINANGEFDDIDVSLLKTYLNGLANVKYRADKISFAISGAVGKHAMNNFMEKHPKTEENR